MGGKFRETRNRVGAHGAEKVERAEVVLIGKLLSDASHDDVQRGRQRLLQVEVLYLSRQVRKWNVSEQSFGCRVKRGLGNLIAGEGRSGKRFINSGCGPSERPGRNHRAREIPQTLGRGRNGREAVERGLASRQHVMHEKAGLVQTIIYFRNHQGSAERDAGALRIGRNLRRFGYVQRIWAGVKSRVCICVKQHAAKPVNARVMGTAGKEDNRAPSYSEAGSASAEARNRLAALLASHHHSPLLPVLLAGCGNVEHVSREQEGVVRARGELQRRVAGGLSACFGLCRGSLRKAQT